MSLADRLTVILTTSAIRSHPSTDLLCNVLESFQMAEGLCGCKVLIVADGARVGSLHRPKQGIVDEDVMARYVAYKAAVGRLCAAGEPPFRNTELIELKTRVGFAFAVLEGLRRTTTELVMVVQHDRLFTRHVRLASVIAFFDRYAHVNYVMLPTKTVARYRRTATSNLHVNVCPEILFLDACMCAKCVSARGEAHNSGGSDSAEGFKMKRNELHNQQCQAQLDADVERLVPLLFWFDTTHVVRRDAYLRLVFPWTVERSASSWTSAREAGIRVVRPGDFIEDTLGHWIKDEMRADFGASFRKYGTFIFYDTADDASVPPVPIVAHISGNKYFTPAQKMSRGYGPICAAPAIGKDKDEEEKEDFSFAHGCSEGEEEEGCSEANCSSMGGVGGITAPAAEGNDSSFAQRETIVEEDDSKDTTAQFTLFVQNNHR